MSKINTGGPAFPMLQKWQADGYGQASNTGYYAKEYSEGMTMRDYFAAKAMPVHMAALSTWDAGSPDAWQAEISRLSYATADAMLRAREAA